MAPKRSKGTELSVFKGREARLNRAIFQILITEGPHTIWDLRKKVAIMKGLSRTRYHNVNVRVRSLEQKGYLKRSGIRETKAGFTANLYEVSSRALCAMLLSSLDLNSLIEELDDISTLTIMALVAIRT